MKSGRPSRHALRWMKFNLVGGVGIVVQLVVLVVLKGVMGLNYLLATGLAVEAAVLHNFAWHQLWTWADRPNGGGRCCVAGRLLRFNLTSGGMSIVSNLVLMKLIAGTLGLNYVAANLLAIAITSVANYLLADGLVFLPVAEPEPSEDGPAPREDVRRSKAPNPPLPRWALPIFPRRFPWCRASGWQRVPPPTRSPGRAQSSPGITVPCGLCCSRSRRHLR